jgi:hypothetical protein
LGLGCCQGGLEALDSFQEDDNLVGGPA